MVREKGMQMKLFWFKTMSHQSITRLRETDILKENANLKLNKKTSCYRRMRILLRLSFVAYTINFFPLLIIYHGSVKRQKRVCSYPWWRRWRLKSSIRPCELCMTTFNHWNWRVYRGTSMLGLLFANYLFTYESLKMIGNAIFCIIAYAFTSW